MNKHTATPWKTRSSDTIKNKNGTYTAVIGEEMGFNFIKVTAAGTWAQEEAEATAAFIVTACNRHEELVEMLQILVDHASEKYPHFESERGQMELDNARTLIQQARGVA